MKKQLLLIALCAAVMIPIIGSETNMSLYDKNHTEPKLSSKKTEIYQQNEGFNYVLNGGFEENAAGSATADSWWHSSDGPGHKATFSIVTDPRSGTNSYQVNVTQRDPGLEDWAVQFSNGSEGVKIPTGKYYRFSIWIKADNENNMVNLLAIINHDPWTPVGGIYYQELTTEWKQYSFLFYNDLEDGLDFVIHLLTTGKYWFDDLEVVEVSTNINAPGVTTSPDTIYTQGTVNIEVAIEDPEMCYGGEMYLFNPRGILNYIYIYLEPGDSVFTFSYEIDSFDMPGFWYISEIHLYYYDRSYTFNYKSTGFVVKNSMPYSSGPQVHNFVTSEDTAKAGDTVLISFEIEDTISGLSYCELIVRSCNNSEDSYLYKSRYFSGEEKAKFQYKYIVGKYETAGQRDILIYLENQNYKCNVYNNEALDFKLEITGTTIDTLPPVLRYAGIKEENDSIIIEMVIKDDVSGVKNFSCLDLFYIGSSGYYSLNYNHVQKVNDTLFTYNITQEDPFIGSGECVLYCCIEDSAGNDINSTFYGTIIIDNKNSDIEPPEIISVEFDKDEALNDNKITLTIRVSDNKSGIARISGTIYNYEYSIY